MSDEKGFPLRERQPELRLMPMVTEINGFGSVFGGWIMSQMDIAGGNAAMLVAGGKVTTAAASITFEHPIRVGNIVSFYAEVVSRGRTSLKVRVEAFAEQGAAIYMDGAAESVRVNGYPHRAAAADFVFVAVDEKGLKRELPPRE